MYSQNRSAGTQRILFSQIDAATQNLFVTKVERYNEYLFLSAYMDRDHQFKAYSNSERKFISFNGTSEEPVDVMPGIQNFIVKGDNLFIHMKNQRTLHYTFHPTIGFQQAKPLEILLEIVIGEGEIIKYYANHLYYRDDNKKNVYIWDIATAKFVYHFDIGQADEILPSSDHFIYFQCGSDKSVLVCNSYMPQSLLEYKHQTRMGQYCASDIQPDLILLNNQAFYITSENRRTLEKVDLIRNVTTWPIPHEINLLQIHYSNDLDSLVFLQESEDKQIKLKIWDIKGCNPVEIQSELSSSHNLEIVQVVNTIAGSIAIILTAVVKVDGQHQLTIYLIVVNEDFEIIEQKRVIEQCNGYVRDYQYSKESGLLVFDCCDDKYFQLYSINIRDTKSIKFSSTCKSDEQLVDVENDSFTTVWFSYLTVIEIDKDKQDQSEEKLGERKEISRRVNDLLEKQYKNYAVKLGNGMRVCLELVSGTTTNVVILAAKTYEILCTIKDIPKTEAMYIYQDEKDPSQVYIMTSTSKNRDRVFTISKLRMFSDNPYTTLPLNILINKGMMTEINESTGLCEVFESSPKGSTADPLYSFKMSSKSIDAITSSQIENGEDESLITTRLLGQNAISENSTECFNYQILQKRAFLHRAATKTKIVEAIIQKSLMMTNEEIPMLLMIPDFTGQTPFDIALKFRQIKIVQSFFQLMTHHGKAVYSKLVDKHLLVLIEMRIDIKQILDSDFLNQRVFSKDYPTIHASNIEKIIPIQFYDSVGQIQRNGLQILDQAFQVSHQDDSQTFHQIEYILMNLPKTLCEGEGKRMMKVLNESARHNIFESQCIQTVINHKWKTYTKVYFLRQFFIFIAFELSFLVSLHTSRSNSVMLTQVDKVSTSFGCILILFLYIHEFRSLLSQGLREYCKDIWNLIDLTLYISFYLYALLKFTKIEGYIPIWILECLIIITGFLKINFFLRIFKGFSFLVSMLIGVFKDLKIFFAFLAMVITTFSLMLYVLLPNTSPRYEGTGIFTYLVIAFRTTLGDFEVDDYQVAEQGMQSTAEEGMQGTAWVVWLCLMIVGNVIFMNFIIAVVTESYEKCMQSQEMQQYRLQVNMIVERERIMTEDELKNPVYFPKFLLLRRPIDGFETQGQQEWHGFVKDIKQAMLKSMQDKQQEAFMFHTRINTQLVQKNESLETKVDGLETKVDSKLEAMTSLQVKVDGRLEAMTSLQTQHDEKLHSFEGRLDAKLESISQLLVQLRDKTM